MEENLDLSKNTDIQDALKEFETKAQVEQVQKVPVKNDAPSTSKMVLLMIKYSGGIVKDERHASYVFLGIVALMISVSLFLFFSSGPKKSKVLVPPGYRLLKLPDAPPKLEKL